MAKKIVLFSDGTGNSSAKAEKTNVWRLFEALVQADGTQVAHYDDGVGTASNKYLAALGGAFGWGLKRNVIDLYKFVCRNHQEGDPIYGFGFSRGAYTIRMVVGLIASQGLVPYETEELLDRKARAAFREYRWTKHWKWHHLACLLRLAIGLLFRLRDALIRDRYDSKANYHNVSVAFLGLWDTVAAYEMPIEEIKRAMDRWLWPMGFSDCTLSPIVAKAFHALSLDDQRATFHPMLWDEYEEARMVRAKSVPAGRLTQVWFAGVHSNVGGGYPEDRLSLVALDWIAQHAHANGLQFNPLALQLISEQKSSFARMYDSRAGGGVFYRYAPRRMQYVPVVHSSVIHRMAEGCDGYAPASLPEKFEVLTPDGMIATLSQASALVQSSNPHKAALGVAMGKLAQPKQEELEFVWDTVWWRRLAYFATVFLATLLVVYPVIDRRLNEGLGTANALSSGIVASLVGALSAFIPNYLTWWVDALRDLPVAFALIVAGLAVSLYFGAFLRTRIQDRAVHAWHDVTRPGLIATFAKRAHGMAILLILGTILAAAVLVRGVYRDWSTQAQIAWGLIFAFMALLALFRTITTNRLERVAGAGVRQPLKGTVMLSIARALRTSDAMQRFNRFFANWFVPAVFLAIMGFIALMLLNKAGIEVDKAVNSSCQATSSLLPVRDKVVIAASDFATRDACWASGLGLEKGARYRIRLDIREEWFDGGHRADLSGFDSDTLVHWAALGLKQSWRGKWFQPLARIGVLGNDEYLLEPVAPFSVHDGYAGRLHTPDPCQPLDDDTARKAVANAPTPPDRRSMTTEFIARTTGELFLYVNDAMPLVGGRECFTRNNRGTAKVSVERVSPAGT
jgi:uncharacterized protein (DUF2235 family)